ncbi:RebB family R body protein [uncultured Pelagimonas sp.]|uniref:RebB family R body protein n=1 Tax=uncultured Pelagimonas sp. TaxID=1618102 RepID=UPI002634012E|nr:RebB family R body protein [uncultured Pelagimonas sp.]
MAEPTAVNSQITDAVTQANVKVLGEAPAMAMGTLFQTMAHSTGLLFENAVSASQQLNITAQAATTMGVSLLYSSEVKAEEPTEKAKK